MKIFLTLLLTATIAISCNNNPYTISSNDSDVVASLEEKDGSLLIDLRNRASDIAIINKSPIAISINNTLAKWELLSSKKSNSSKTLPLLYGEFDQIELSYQDMECRVRLTAAESVVDGNIIVRIFKNSMAYRLTLDNLPEGCSLRELSSWIPADRDGGCLLPNGEHEPIGALPISEVDKPYTTPIIFKGESQTIALHEADLYDYPQLLIEGDSLGGALNIKIEEIECSGRVELPWRIVMVGSDIKDLHNQKPIYQALSREPSGDFSWVKPGLSMWDWRVRGTTFDGFTYQMDTESLKRFIDFCHQSNIAYLLVDAAWYEDHNPLKAVEGLDIEEVIEHGRQMGVGLILYYDLKYADSEHPVIEFEKIAEAYSSLGAVGIKYGFLSAESSRAKTNMTQDIIKTAAKHRLLIDFHDGPTPFSALERTYPNYINREYCHAQLDRRAAFNPRQFVKMACINLLAGHIDQTNGTYALNEMATRSKGPMNEYPSTVSAETARFITTHTGSLSVMIDAPEAYQQKADLFTAISSLPAKWDETRYLEMEFDSHTAVAKRKGDRWFVAVVYGDKGGRHNLSLEFLEPSSRYRATIYQDAKDTDQYSNKEAYTINHTEVTSSDNIEVDVVDGGGFTIIFEKE